MTFRLIGLQLERAYTLWATKDIHNEVGSNKRLLATRFCHASYGRYQTQYADSAAKIKDAQWEVIIKAARRISKASQKPVNSSVIILEDKIDSADSKFHARRANLVEIGQ